MWLVPVLLWVDEILHHLRSPGLIRFPCKYQQTMVCHGFRVVQHFAHPQYVPFFDSQQELTLFFSLGRGPPPFHVEQTRSH